MQRNECAGSKSAKKERESKGDEKGRERASAFLREREDGNERMKERRYGDLVQ